MNIKNNIPFTKIILHKGYTNFALNNEIRKNNINLPHIKFNSADCIPDMTKENFVA